MKSFTEDMVFTYNGISEEIAEAEETDEPEETEVTGEVTDAEGSGGPEVTDEVTDAESPEEPGEKVERKNWPQASYEHKLAYVKSLNIKEVEGIATNSASFQIFVGKVVEWLKIPNQKDYFMDIVKNVCDSSGDFSWYDIEKGVIRQTNDRIKVADAVNQRFRKYQVWLKDFLILMREYYYRFSHSDIEEVEEPASSQSDVDEDVSDKIETILSEMGVDELPEEERKIIFNIVIKAFNNESDVIQDFKARAELAKFLNYYTTHRGLNPLRTEDFIATIRERMKN